MSGYRVASQILHTPYAPHTHTTPQQLALLTVVMGLGGTLIRVFTTYKKLGPKDPQLFMYAASALLNLLLFAQVILWLCICMVRGRRASLCVYEQIDMTHAFVRIHPFTPT